MIWPRDRLTRFEVARLLGARSLQIALGAPILLPQEEIGDLDSIRIAKKEFKNKIIPITIKRKMPSGEEMTIDVKAAIENWLIDHEGQI
jgi:DNA-directed RNA polymerase subunit K